MDDNGRPVSRGPTDDQTILNNGSVSWSPDGKRLAGVGQPGTKAGYIWIIDPASTTPFRKLVDLPRTHWCVVRPGPGMALPW